MPIEIERKFLVTGDAWRDAAHEVVPMTQGYLNDLAAMDTGAMKASVRVRIQGDEAYLNSLFGDVAASMTSHRRTAVFRFRSAEENVDFFRTYYGPTLRVFDSLDAPRREALRNDLLALARRYDRNGGTGPIALTADYLETVIVRK